MQWTNSNVVLVDWSKWTQKLDYTDVVLQLPVVGTYLFDWLSSLRDRGIVQSLDDVTLIGHSLGAQLIGYTGHRLNGTIKRVIGTYVIFESWSQLYKLSLITRTSVVKLRLPEYIDVYSWEPSNVLIYIFSCVYSIENLSTYYDKTKFFYFMNLFLFFL